MFRIIGSYFRKKIAEGPIPNVKIENIKNKFNSTHDTLLSKIEAFITPGRMQ
jgi:hypothetical protein